MATVLLFDVDGTLVDTAGAGRRAMEDAFEAVCGRRDACAEVRFGGMTDRGIARAGFRAVGHPDGEDAIDALIDAYLSRLEAHLAEAAGYRVLPGVEVLLDAVTRDGTALGLGTGNVERGARIKLGRGGLSGRFGFGGFGCDAEERAELLAAGAARGAAILGRPVSECRVVVIGDTPRDVAAARAIGAECVAVATGTAPARELAGADVIVADLTDDAARQILSRS